MSDTAIENLQQAVKTAAASGPFAASSALTHSIMSRFALDHSRYAVSR